MGNRTQSQVAARRYIARGFAYLTEDRKGEGIVPELSVRDNLTLVCLRTLTKNGVVDVDEATARSWISFIESLGIKLRSPDQPIRELSGGNQQKGSACALACNPPQSYCCSMNPRAVST